MPAVIPVTTLVEPMVAIAVLLLLHVPPAVPSARVVVRPGHVAIVPVMAAGNAFMVNVFVTLQPKGYKYVITGFVLPVTPVTIPVDEPIVALIVEELLQVPPADALLNVVVDPTHTTAVPVIAAGV